MSDLISRQALMKEFSDFVRESNNSDFAQTPTWNDAVSLVGSMPSAQQWIPCSERMPEEDGEYLVWIDTSTGLHYEISGFSKEYGGFCNLLVGKWQVIKLNNVMAWMPLPAPYEGSNE